MILDYTLGAIIGAVFTALVFLIVLLWLGRKELK